MSNATRAELVEQLRKVGVEMVDGEDLGETCLGLGFERVAEWLEPGRPA